MTAAATTRARSILRLPTSTAARPTGTAPPRIRIQASSGSWAGDLEATAQQKVYNAFYNEMKTAIEKASPAGVGDQQPNLGAYPGHERAHKAYPHNRAQQRASLSDVSRGAQAPGARIDPRQPLASKSGRVGQRFDYHKQLSTCLSSSGDWVLDTVDLETPTPRCGWRMRAT